MKNFSIRYQILLIPFFSMLVVCFVALFCARITCEKIDESHRLQLKSVTESAVTVVAALHAEAEAGRLTPEKAQELARAALRSIRFAGDEYFYAYDFGGKLVAHAVRPELENTYEFRDMTDANGVKVIQELIRVSRAGGGFVPFQWPKPGEKAPSDKLGYAAVFAPWGWTIGTGVYVDDVMSETWRSLISILVIGGVSIALVFLIGLTVARGIGRRIQSQAGRMMSLADGDLDSRSEEDGGRDEVAAMARSLEVFRQRMIENRDMAAAREAEQAARAQEAERIAALAQEFDAAVTTVLESVTAEAAALERNASGMSAAADVASGRSVTVAAAAEQASVNVQTVAAATEEMTSSITEIGRQVTNSAKIASEAANEVERTSGHVQGLAESVQKIGAVVSLINDIASQTNLLALNATIEAARAGDAGKGFAVVAGEVKNLANQTAKATGEIGEQITEIQQATGVAVSAIDGFSGIIDTINESSTTIASAVRQQGAATQEITRNVHEAATGTTQVSEAIAEVTQAVAQAGQTAQDVLQAAGRLRTQCDSLRGQVHTFLTGVRGAR